MFFKQSDAMSELGQTCVSTFLETFAERGLKADNFGMVVVRQPAKGAEPEGFSWRGDWVCYPCSVVKSFHLIHALHALDAGLLTPHDDLDRAMRDMILWSSNTATNYVIDLLTRTTGDTLLEGDELEAWIDRREGLNRFFHDLKWPEYAGCNISQKLMGDIRYGREATYASRDGGYLNALTPLVAARLVHELFDGDLPLSEAGRERAQRIMFRDRNSPEAKMPKFQVDNYLGGGAPADWLLWSKCGWNPWSGDERTSYFKHDLARIQKPGEPALTISLMTKGKALCEDHPEMFPQMSRIVLSSFGSAA
jgi:hypothetical protein